MLTDTFAFHAPTSVEDAIALLGDGTGNVLLGGGMSLLPLINLGIREPGGLVSLAKVEGLAGVTETAGVLRIGASTTHAGLAADPTARAQCPVLAEAAGLIADVQVRNRGTVGGSLAHGYPGAEYATVMSALDATVHLRGPAGSRSVPVRELVHSRLVTAVRPDEVITHVSVPATPPGMRAAYLRFSRVQGNYSTVNVAVVVTGERVTLGIGGALEKPVVVETTQHADIESLAGNACAGAYTDHMASAEYRVAMAGVLSRRVLNIALTRASEVEK
ncbi:FAD binding domain-containing protein [Nocardia sp. R7R-8]|uniref:FAD binding domain-containing protein n=1 Tax=Nocardia sp. R7R-8 TaxID=3459304 RepID=UPI00403DA2B6